jgi:hypothetical protein
LGSFLIKEVVRIYGLHFSTVLILTRNWLGYIFGNFFSKSSGHPGQPQTFSASDKPVNQDCQIFLGRKTPKLE